MTRVTRLNPLITADDVSAAPSVITTKIVVKPTGGDYTSPKLAADFINTQSPSATNQFDMWIYPGTYTEIQWIVPAYTALRGIGRLGQIWLKGEQPDSTSDANTTANSTIQVEPTCTLINLKITARNMRYPVHSEQAGANADAVHTITGCHIEHYGNQGVIDYRVTNSLPAGAPWPNCLPWGYGSASGVIENFINTTLIGPTYGAFYVHNNANFNQPTINTLDMCRMVSTDPTQIVILTQGLGSGQADRVNITNCEVSGGNYASESDDPWIPTDLPSQYANHSDFRLTYSGTPIGWATTNRGKALAITSASTGSVSTVRVSGTAADAVFSATPSYRDGGGGLQGYAYGDFDISGILVGVTSSTTVNNTIGRRLGDCSSVNKTLTVAVDGGSPINIVFSTNLTAVSNATIISTINTALGGAAAVAAEYLVSQGEVYPHFVDRQATEVNSDTVGIPRWAAVKRVAGKVLLLQVSDTVTSFYGVALEPIPPGQYGRILTKGLLTSGQLKGAPTVTEGVAIYHSDVTAGAFSTSGSRLFGVGSINGFCSFRGADSLVIGTAAGTAADGAVVAGQAAGAAAGGTAYQKPGSGIPESDLATAAQTKLDAGGTAYQKPGTGIPESDLETAAQTKLDAGGTSVQPGGALGTPSSGTATNLTGLPLAGLLSTAYATAATASTLAERDAQANIVADAFVPGFTTTVTAAATTTLTVDSTEIQVFTGSTTQTCQLPTTGIVAGQRYTIKNASTGAVTITASGGSTVLAISSGVTATVTALVATPTTASNWFVVTGISANITAGAAASSLAQRDGNANFAANAFTPSFTTTATAGATTTLTIASTETQVFTGSLTQTVLLPTTGIVAGQRYRINNQSTGNVTVQSSGANTVLTLAVWQAATFTALVATPTTAAHWVFESAPSLAVDTAATALTLVERSGSAAITGNAFNANFRTQATAAATTTLVVGDAQIQAFTGSTTQTCVLPTTSIPAGRKFEIINTSSGAVTINSSGGNLVKTLAASAETTVTALVTTPTTAAHWFATA